MSCRGRFRQWAREGASRKRSQGASLRHLAGPEGLRRVPAQLPELPTELPLPQGAGWAGRGRCRTKDRRPGPASHSRCGRGH